MVHVALVAMSKVIELQVRDFIQIVVNVSRRQMSQHLMVIIVWKNLLEKVVRKRLRLHARALQPAGKMFESTIHETQLRGLTESLRGRRSSSRRAWANPR